MRKIVILFVALTLSSGVYAQTTAFKDKSKCFSTAQDFVKQKLTFPKTAKFDRNYFHETDGYGKAIVLGKVTSKNAFGVPSEYVYKIWLEHNGADWTSLKNWTMRKMLLEDATTGKQSWFDS